MGIEVADAARRAARRRSERCRSRLGCPVTGGDDAEIAAAVAVARGRRRLRRRARRPGRAVRPRHVGRGLRRRRPAPARPAGGAARGAARHRHAGGAGAAGRPAVRPVAPGRPARGVVCGFFPGEEGARGDRRRADRAGQPLRPAAGAASRAPADASRRPTSAPRWRGAARSAASTRRRCSRSGTACPTHRSRGSTSRLSDEAWTTDGTYDVSVSLRNEHGRPTTEVVQVYLHDLQAEVVRPVQQLIGAARVDLGPGESRTVTFTLHADLTSYTGRRRRSHRRAGDRRAPGRRIQRGRPRYGQG